ncbi:hybrid sensor histidine kinase/response regulator [Cytophagales bacterium WSM2-2]|nr:hybrid sensor histidine kinase/response regulator [Cytophagales bacterium WSM2-2]
MDRTVTILIIDDKPSNIYVLEKLLEKPERVLVSATSGAEGLKLALNREIDLVILDVQMPEMDGFEVAKILKSNKRTRDVPIIFASAEAKERESIMKGFEEGAVDYLSKPLDPEVTKAKVSVLLKIQLQKKELLEKNLSLENADRQIKELNLELKKNLSQLETANKELESFSYSVSHDLRAPLRTLNGYASILLEDYSANLDGEANRLLQGIQGNADKMNNLIEDLLRLSKLERQEVEKTEVDVLKLVQNIISDIGNSIQHNANIILNPLLPAHADRSLLAQVWVNLISNAIKYSAKKDNPRVEISSSKQNGEVVYHIKDNGAGFNMDYADKLFGVFQRLHKSAEFEGTGIGLAIVKRVVSKHGGRVWAEAKPNEGATFFFSLPF